MPQRVHGAFVSDQEVHRVVEALKKSAAPELHRGGAARPVDADSGLSGEDEEIGSVGAGDAEAGSAVRSRRCEIVTRERKPSIS